MELFGILFSVPFVFVASMGWCALLAFVVRRIEPLRRFLLVGGGVVLALLLLEVDLLIGLGSRGSYHLFGWGFYGLYLVNFVFGSPALANVLVLRTKPDFVRRSWVAGFLCTALGVGLVLLPYGVLEAIFGVNGDGDPDR